MDPVATFVKLACGNVRSRPFVINAIIAQEKDC